MGQRRRSREVALQILYGMELTEFSPDEAIPSHFEAMTTNETFFFRDKTPFDHFRQAIMPEVLKARASRKSIRIWCAAGSTGQEPYSLAMCSQARTVSAIVVSVGPHVPLVTKQLLSVTNTFGASQSWFMGFSTEVFGSSPMRAVPMLCQPAIFQGASN